MKFVTLGIYGSGKSSLLHRLKHGEPLKEYVATHGITVQTLYQDGNELHAWDYTGGERYKELSAGYCIGASGIIFMFDSEDGRRFRDSLDYLKLILSDEVITNMTVMVVANKQDLKDTVGPEVIERIIKKKWKIIQGNSLFVMPMIANADDDRSVQLAYRLFIKMMKRKQKGLIQNGLIPRAWETAEKEAEDSEMDDDGEATQVADG